jgi:hypothetical protein
MNAKFVLRSLIVMVRVRNLPIYGPRGGSYFIKYQSSLTRNINQKLISSRMEV